ncbi:hypothetical protein LAZ67_21001757 [Cordylochernes scorpioides]|uniref:Uncharacterized protein n=1 Tax=Cordylochernes scorpioides TaxID=51811 RepID=A0ABY6LNB7_9ARAC|nr:hypothetical protein LAZ67_21001757 [Cordylochernes scorpioides]
MQSHTCAPKIYRQWAIRQPTLSPFAFIGRLRSRVIFGSTGEGESDCHLHAWIANQQQQLPIMETYGLNFDINATTSGQADMTYVSGMRTRSRNMLVTPNINILGFFNRAKECVIKNNDPRTIALLLEKRAKCKPDGKRNMRSGREKQLQNGSRDLEKETSALRTNLEWDDHM